MQKNKISTVVAEFQKSTAHTLRLVDKSIQMYSPGPGNPGASNIVKSQLDLIFEAAFFNCFREFENSVEQIFLLYCLEKTCISGRRPRSYLKPKNKNHVLDMIKSSNKYIDWNSPDILIDRSELYLKDGFLIKTAISLNKTKLHEARKIRNHIAHKSRETEYQFKKVLTSNLRTLPIKLPTSGEYLRMRPRSGTSARTFLDNYVESFSIVIKQMTQ